MGISILCPTRNRPQNIERLWNSIKETANGPIELILYVDLDDNSYDGLTVPAKIVRGPRIVLSEMWNRCFEQATYDVLMHCGDDIIFRTKDWDLKVLSTFDEYPDHIVFVFGNDGSLHDGKFGTHGFIHRKWAETLGYFVPPYFASDYNDTWLNEVAQIINRHKHIDILTEHMHPNFNKAVLDITHKERLVRHVQEDVNQIYMSKQQDRILDAEKLRKVMHD